ncbi:DUF1501 domain-containing protein [Dokdonella fugitiva]|jgi:uncharacterized protein (DUF1501 family)|uniref:Uncharacterized protein (DUF1501 family) n=1 Tax=Dokdonella fugitiva TaxID=328517 RepID=A0A4R2HWZ2_9GAMM|nr:DUF1501 domain-containing protein [Dokdonella fugitiva]TCO36091.1 uncharacterized protein (DUF1501 family) [Dokdonella fugitiva]
MTPDRRAFLRRSLQAALGGVALNSPLGNLVAVAAAARPAVPSTFSDYRALVCVFLHGGNDSFSSVVPVSPVDYAIYQATRPALALPLEQIQPNTLVPQPDGMPSDGATYGLHPSLAPLKALFEQQQLAIVANVGPLLGPITKAQYQANPLLAPPQLFSHSDQANFWQTSRPDDASADGWGGRIADLLLDANPDATLPMTISIQGQSLFQRGSLIDQYVVRGCAGGSCAAERIDYLGTYQNQLGIQTFQALAAEGAQSHMFERAYARATRRTIDHYETLSALISTVPDWNVPFPSTNLGGQLRQVANLISLRGPGALDMHRQLFFVGQGGYDTHDDQLAIQPGLLADLAQSLVAFQAAMAQLGVTDEVTTFTASDFGRTLSTNGDGTDHGWGGHHFVLGGAVRGGRFYGRMPSLAQHDNPDDAGYGQIIPTTGVDQYAATLAAWYGVNTGDLPLLFPRLGEYDSPNLGFMT